MSKQNTVENDLNATRIRLYEETKDMTPDERIAYFRSLSATIRNKHNILTFNEANNNTQQALAQ